MEYVYVICLEGNRIHLEKQGAFSSDEARVVVKCSRGTPIGVFHTHHDVNVEPSIFDAWVGVAEACKRGRFLMCIGSTVTGEAKCYEFTKVDTYVLRSLQNAVKYVDEVLKNSSENTQLLTIAAKYSEDVVNSLKRAGVMKEVTPPIPILDEVKKLKSTTG